MRKKYKLLLGVMLVLLLAAMPQTAMAGETGTCNIRDGEVVFLLDTSVSMNTQDQDRSALDMVRLGAYSLPSNYRTGLVAYNTGIQTVVPLGSDPAQLEQPLGAVTYTGYTNAGEGLDQAMNLFSDREGVDRYIIMLSDGEIDMPGSQAREQSRKLYAEAGGRARDKGVKIFIAAIGSELGNPRMHIFDGAELTNGAIYWEGQSGSLSQIMERILSDRMDFPKKEIKPDGNNIHADIPGGASRIKLLVVTDGRLGTVTADVSADRGKTITGQGFALVDITQPSGESLDVSLQVPEGAAVKSYLLTEYSASPQVTAGYRIEELPRTEKEVKKRVPPKYKHFVDITIKMMDDSRNYGNIWENGFDGQKIPYTLNGEQYTGTLQSGELKQTLDGDLVDQVEVFVDTSGFNAVYCVKQPVTERVEKIPDPVYMPPPDYRPLWAVIGALAAALIVLFVLWVRRRSTAIIYVAQPPASNEPVRKMETRSCTYSGKLNLYVVRTQDGRDLPPQTYRLFGKKSGRMTLNQILTACGIKFGKIGAEDIVAYPGPDHALIIMDQSESCTVLRGTEILKKGMGYPVFYNEKLTVTFDDDATELEIHYKNIKPSEREDVS